MTQKRALKMEIATARKINDSKMRAPAGILHFAAQQAGTCQGMQGRQWERDARTRNEQRKRQNCVSGFGEERNHLVFHVHFICEVSLHKLSCLNCVIVETLFAQVRCLLNSTTLKCFSTRTLVNVINQAIIMFLKEF